MCPQSYDQNAKGVMDTSLAVGLVDQARRMGVHSIKWNWRGEATLHRDIVDLTRHAKKIGIPEVQLNTNGNMRGCDVRSLIQNGIDRIIFSVDGDTKETFESIRHGGDFDELVRTINDALFEKKHFQLKKPFIRVQMCKQTANAHEVEAFTNRWKDVVDDVRVSQVTDRGADGFLHIGDLVAHERAFCQQPFQRLTIGYDGKVMGCCADWFEHRPVGDAKRTPLREIWSRSVMLDDMRGAQIREYQDDMVPCSKCWAKDGYKWRRGEGAAPEGDYQSLAGFMGAKPARPARNAYRKALHRK